MVEDEGEEVLIGGTGPAGFLRVCRRLPLGIFELRVARCGNRQNKEGAYV